MCNWLSFKGSLLEAELRELRTNADILVSPFSANRKHVACSTLGGGLPGGNLLLHVFLLREERLRSKPVVPVLLLGKYRRLSSDPQGLEELGVLVHVGVGGGEKLITCEDTISASEEAKGLFRGTQRHPSSTQANHACRHDHSSGSDHPAEIPDR
mmetsp:Transcript_14427/g.21047  ORF Transcript_14427/g.21047 Transcript_14427/m.21047 type:complete len:155 (+) Transcript_14427:52-516(+)